MFLIIRITCSGQTAIDEDGEERWHAIGMVDAVLLLVVHVYRSTNDEEEIVRIISARKASKHEGRGYFQ
jgi:uncharacterized protein